MTSMHFYVSCMYVHTVFGGVGIGAAGASALSSLTFSLLFGLLELADCAVPARAGSLMEAWVASKKCISSLTAIGPCSLHYKLDNVISFSGALL